MQLELLEDRQLLSTITVNTTADDATPDANLSLRQAIEVSDGTLAVSSLSLQEQALVSGPVGSTNTINFNIPTSDPGYNSATGAWTIAVKSALPTISTNAAIINGYSQPGASENTLAQGDNAKIAIAIDGTSVGGNGFTVDQQGSQLRGLDIENFALAGVVITAAGNVQVAGCFIGTDASGETRAANGTGVELENSFNTVGGPNVGDRNVISGSGNAQTSSFAHDGVYVPSQSLNPLNIAPTGNVVENNILGLDARGTKVIANEYAGAADFASGNTYGGTAAGLGNVISGNLSAGLYTTGSVTIEGNDIGTDATGTVALGNGQGGGYGIANLEATSSTSISTTISNNVISGNATGILLSQTAGSQSTYTISNNLIGTDAAGTAALGSGTIGIDLNSIENATVQNNVVSSNSIGIRTQTPTTSGVLQHDVFQGNLIGTDKTGQVALGNTLYGIEVETGAGITIGGTGPGQGNVIANSGYYGIYLEAGQQIQFSRNSIFDNAKQGIYRGYGANGFVGTPTLTFAPGAGNSGTLSGTINFPQFKNTTIDIEIFSNPTAQATEGQTYVDDVKVTTDGTGQGSFSLSEPTGFYTATATDPSGDTSDFSAVAETVTLADTVTTVTSSANPSTSGQKVTFTAAVTAPASQGTPTGTLTFTIDGQAQTPVPIAVFGGVDEAQFQTSALTAGAHSVSAAYSGDSVFAASSGSLPTQTVNPAAPGAPAAPLTTLTSSLNPSTIGEQVAFTAVVTANGSQGTPTGNVTFTIDGQAQAPVALSVVGGVDEALFRTSTMTAGAHSVSAAYSGDSAYATSSGSLPTQTVNAAGLPATTTTVTSPSNPSTVGEQVTFTATVAPSSGTGTPSGDVTFTIDGKKESPVVLKLVNGHDQASFPISTLSAGQHSISATYDGDSVFASSGVTRPLSQTVIGAPTVDGPTVGLVQRFGIHMEPTVLVVTFNGALDPAGAQDVHNYVIVGPARRHIAIDSAVYDASTDTVTLRPSERINLHHNYHFTVVGTGPNGVDSANHTLLDGVNDGGPGSNYVTILNWKSVVLTPAQARKLHSHSQAKPGGALAHRFASPKR
jgi:Bacterial Ig-like domain (group 3)